MSSPLPGNKAGVSLYQDVIDRIIDCFDELSDVDTPMLATCSLVCRAWLQHSQMHLLKAISFSTQERLVLFISALSTLSERFRSSIRTLIIHVPCGPPETWQGSHLLPPRQLSITPAHVISLLDGLPKLLRLSFISVQLDVSDRVSQGHFCRRSLETLHFVNVTNTAYSHQPVAEIIAFISLFQNIHSLSAHIPSYYTTAPQDISGGVESRLFFTPPISLRVNTVSILGSRPTHLGLFQFFRDAIVSSSLRTITFSFVDADTAVALEGLLCANAFVEEIAVYFWDQHLLAHSGECACPLCISPC